VDCAGILQEGGRRGPIMAPGRMKRFVLPQIRESVASGTYEACTFDYEAPLPDGRTGRKAWTDIFRKAIPEFEKRARMQLVEDAASDEEEITAGSRARSFAENFGRALDKLEANPNRVIPGFEAAFARDKGGRGLSCKVLCAVRETCLLMLGLRDAFKHVKRKENCGSLAILGPILDEVDALPGTPRDRMELALRNCFAGNLFDLGAHFSSERYQEGGESREDDPLRHFRADRENLPPRPWMLDCLEEAAEALSEAGRFRKAIVFADNAGADLILGIFPFVRELLKAGTTVVLAANEKPAINDITAEELAALFSRFSAAGAPTVTDPLLCSACAEGRLRVVSSGSDLPIIDLSMVSSGVVDEAEGADLIILQGMGRAIESNLNAKFSSAVLKMGVMKHPEVALCLGGKLGEPICKLELPEAQSLDR